LNRKTRFPLAQATIDFDLFNYFMGMTDVSPVVGIIMGSDSDLPTMQAAIAVCEEFEIAWEVAIVSAHRTPERMVSYAQTAHERGLKVIIAGAGGAAHLPGMVAALTPLPVIGVPVQTRTLQGVDSLYSIVQMPAGIPVATVAIGNAKNAGLLAIQILASHDPELLAKVQAYRQNLQKSVLEKQATLEKIGYQSYLATMNQKD
jgi:5-(carboxyamino)imidazole ribonucleotide mutase